MKPSELKSFIKEAVREAIQEELKDILLEAVRAPKLPIQETYQMNNLLSPVSTGTSTQVTNSPPQKSSTEKRAMVESIMGDMRRGQDTLSFNSTDARGAGINQTTLQVAPGMNTSGEGSSLPAGNVGLDMIMGLMKKGK
jgi:hypothetical protein